MILKHLKSVPVQHSDSIRRIRRREIGLALAAVSVLASWSVMAARPMQTQAPTYSVLYSFQCGNDGQDPLAGLVRDSVGNLYGTTYGTIFELSPSGTEPVLHRFDDNLGDGSAPKGSLVRDPTGNLFGTTNVGGGNTTACPTGCGTVFKLSPTGRETLLHSFAGQPTDGQYPYGNLVPDTAGNLYGTTSKGDDNNSGINGGTVFQIARTGAETILHSFVGGVTDGEVPFAGLVRDSTGNLYGTTFSGGAFGFGTVFELTPAGVETILHSFELTTADGQARRRAWSETLPVVFTAPPTKAEPSTRELFSSWIQPAWKPSSSTSMAQARARGPLGLAQDAKGNLFGGHGRRVWRGVRA